MDAWKARLRKGLEKYVIPIIETGETEIDKQRKEQLLDERRMKLWVQVFTDAAYTEASYEPYEFYGDKIAGVFVTKYILQTFPRLQPNQMSSLVSHYTSNDVQGTLMTEFEVRQGDVTKTFLEAFMLKPAKSTHMTLTPAIYADMYEALLGGICTAGDDIINGLGMMYAAKWFEHIFVKNIKLDMSFSHGEASSILTGLFSRFDFYSEGPDAKILLKKRDLKDGDSTKSSVEYRAVFTESVRTFLLNLDPSDFSDRKKERVPQKGAVIARATAPTKAEAREDCARKALDWLEANLGITEEWANRLKQKLDTKAVAADHRLSGDYARVIEYLSRLGYTNMRFKNLPKHSLEGNYQGIQIIADRKSDGNTKVFFTRLYEKGNRYVVRKQAIQDMANEKIR